MKVINVSNLILRSIVFRTVFFFAQAFSGFAFDAHTLSIAITQGGGFPSNNAAEFELIRQISWDEIDSSPLFLLKELTEKYSFEDSRNLPRHWIKAFKFVVTAEKSPLSRILKASEYGEYLQTRPSPCGQISAKIAEMDFPTPSFLTIPENKIGKINGYSVAPVSMLERFSQWRNSRMRRSVTPSNCLTGRHIMEFAAIALSILTTEGDDVIVESPTYPAITTLLERMSLNKLEVSSASAIDDIIKLVESTSARTIFIVNPHNPTGRIWTREELKKLSRLAKKHKDLRIIVDSAHYDLAYKNVIPFEQFPGLEQHTISLYSPAKAMNTSGEKIAFAVTKNEKIRALMRKHSGIFRTYSVGTYAKFIANAAYSAEARIYLKKTLIPYLKKNRDFLTAMLSEFSTIEVDKPDGTFLSWMKFPDYKEDSLESNLLEGARLVVADGQLFGAYQPWVRFNFAMPSGKLAVATLRLIDLYRKPS